MAPGDFDGAWNAAGGFGVRLRPEAVLWLRWQPASDL